MDSPKGMERRHYSSTSMVITIGGELSSVGWVDLWRGILFCDAFPGSKQLRYISLPPPVVPKLPQGAPQLVRDVMVAGDYIKFFDMHPFVKVGVDCYGELVSMPDGWVAATRKMSLSKLESTKEWKHDSEATSSEVQLKDVTPGFLKFLQ